MQQPHFSIACWRWYFAIHTLERNNYENHWETRVKIYEKLLIKWLATATTTVVHHHLIFLCVVIFQQELHLGLLVN